MNALLFRLRSVIIITRFRFYTRFILPATDCQQPAGEQLVAHAAEQQLVDSAVGLVVVSVYAANLIHMTIYFDGLRTKRPTSQKFTRLYFFGRHQSKAIFENLKTRNHYLSYCFHIANFNKVGF